MNSYDVQVMRTAAAPEELSQTALDMYREYCDGYSRMSGGARVDVKILPLIVVMSKRIDAMAKSEDSSENNRKPAVHDNNPPKARKPMSEKSRKAAAERLAEGRRKAQERREALAANG